MSTATDPLLEPARRGDPAARAELVERYQPLIRRTVQRSRRFAHQTSFEADDLYQQATLAFLELIDEFDPDRCRGFGAYVKAMLPYRVYNCLRSHGRWQRGERTYGLIAPDAWTEPVTVEPALNGDGYPVANPRLRRALARLSPRRAAVLAHLFGADRSSDETAAALGIGRRAVNLLRARALAQLRAELAGPADSQPPAGPPP